MGESELKIALQREGEEQVRAFWQAAEEKVAKRRQELKEEQEKPLVYFLMKIKMILPHLQIVQISMQRH